jgi:hypothetical protein
MRQSHAFGAQTKETAVKIDTSHARLLLEPVGHAQLHNARNVRLTGLEGTTWITVEGELQDVFIGPGESFVVPNDGKVIAVALHAPALIALDGSVGAVRSMPSPRRAHWLRNGLTRLSLGTR